MKNTTITPISHPNTLRAEARRLEHRKQRRQWRKQIRSQLPRLSLLGMGMRWK